MGVGEGMGGVGGAIGTGGSWKSYLGTGGGWGNYGWGVGELWLGGGGGGGGEQSFYKILSTCEG